jgi:hypothetical protein
MGNGQAVLANFTILQEEYSEEMKKWAEGAGADPALKLNVVD